jgi:predicted nuclease with TOPRIM domain
MLMAVMMPRETWTDQRLDDLNKKVDDGFANVDARFDRVEGRMNRLEDRMDALTDRFEALNRTLIGGFFVLVAALIGSSATLAGVALF